MLEEAPPAPVAEGARPGPQLLVLSAATASALARRKEDLDRHLAARPDLPLADVAWTLQAGRRALAHRLAMVRDEAGEAADAGRRAELAALGERWVAGEEVDWRALHAGEARSRVPLPVYPLESRRCWHDQVAGGKEEAAAAEPLPLSAPSGIPTEIPPGTARERLLCEIWREVLGVPEVGLHDDFFELGGDSVLGTLIAGRARAHGLVISADHLFVYPTVARLATAAVEVEIEAAPVPAFDLDPAAVERLARRRGKRSAGP